MTDTFLTKSAERKVIDENNGILEGFSESAAMSWWCIGIIVIILLFAFLIEMIKNADDTGDFFGES